MQPYRRSLPLLLLLSLLASPLRALTYSQEVSQARGLLGRFQSAVQAGAPRKQLENLALEISQSYQARLMLKDQAPKVLGEAYFDLWFSQPDPLFDRLLGGVRTRLAHVTGLPADVVSRIQLIRNQESMLSRSPPMDLDVGIVAATREEGRKLLEQLRDLTAQDSKGRLVKGIEAFEVLLQEALESSYESYAGLIRKLPGVKAAKAFLEATHPFQVEAYADVEVLKKAGVPQRALIEQTTSVGKRKVLDFQHFDRSLMSLESAAQEAARGTVKDVSKMRRVFAEVERLYGVRPALSPQNADILALLQKLGRSRNPARELRSLQALVGGPVEEAAFLACNQLLDNMEAAWKLAPSNPLRAHVWRAFSKVLDADEMAEFVAALDGDPDAVMPSRAAQMLDELEELVEGRLVKLGEGAPAPRKGSARRLLDWADPDLAKASSYVDELPGEEVLDELAGLFGKAEGKRFGKIKELLPRPERLKAAQHFRAKGLALDQVDSMMEQVTQGKGWKQLGEADSTLRLDGALSLAMCLHEMNGVLDQENLSPEQEQQLLYEAWARNLPVVGDFFQGLTEGYAGALTGDKKRMLEGALFLAMGAAGLFPPAQLGAMVAGLTLVAANLGSSAWDVYQDEQLFEAWIASGRWDEEKGELLALKWKGGGELDMSPRALASLVRPDPAATSGSRRRPLEAFRAAFAHEYLDGLAGVTALASLHDYAARGPLKGQKSLQSLHDGLAQLYPDVTLEPLAGNFRSAGAELARKIRERGGDPRRDPAMGIFLHLRNLHDAVAARSLNTIREAVEAEYQARNLTGDVLAERMALEALGKELGLPLVENTYAVFGALGSVVKELAASPFVRESMARRRANLRKRYLEGYREIRRILVEVLGPGFESVGLNPPKLTRWNLTGFLEVDLPRVESLGTAFGTEVLGPARRIAQELHGKLDAPPDFDPRGRCEQAALARLGAHRLKQLVTRDQMLRMRAWKGEVSAATASRDRALARAQQVVDDQGLFRSAWSRLAASAEAAYAWSRAQVPGEGGYEVYDRRARELAERLGDLEVQEPGVADRALRDWKSCLREQRTVYLFLVDGFSARVGQPETLHASVETELPAEDYEIRWTAGGSAIGTGTEVVYHPSESGDVMLEVRAVSKPGGEVLARDHRLMRVYPEEDDETEEAPEEAAEEEEVEEDDGTPVDCAEYTRWANSSIGLNWYGGDCEGITQADFEAMREGEPPEGIDADFGCHTRIEVGPDGARRTVTECSEEPDPWETTESDARGTDVFYDTGEGASLEDITLEGLMEVAGEAETLGIRRVGSGGPVVLGAPVAFEVVGGEDADRYRWEPHPTVVFQPHEGPGRSTMARFERPGRVGVWVVALEQDGETWQTLAEAEALSVEVVAPRLSMRFEPESPRVGTVCTAVVEVDPDPGPGGVDLRWMPPEGEARELHTSPDGRRLAFLPGSDRRIRFEVLARVPVHGDELGRVTGNLVPRAYEVRVEAAGKVGRRSMTWKAGIGLVEDASAPLPGEAMRFRARIEPTPRRRPSYRWTVGEACERLGFDGEEIRVAGRQAGSCEVRVEVLDKEERLLGGATTQFEVRELPRPGELQDGEEGQEEGRAPQDTTEPGTEPTRAAEASPQAETGAEEDPPTPGDLPRGPGAAPVDTILSELPPAVPRTRPGAPTDLVQAQAALRIDPRARSGDLDALRAQLGQQRDRTGAGPALDYELGRVLLAGGDPEEAVEHYRKSLERYPDRREFYRGFSSALRHAGRPEEALSILRVALERFPADPTLRNARGVCLAVLGRREEAEAIFAALVEEDPGYLLAKRNLEELRGDP